MRAFQSILALLKIEAIEVLNPFEGRESLVFPDDLKGVAVVMVVIDFDGCEHIGSVKELLWQIDDNAFHASILG